MVREWQYLVPGLASLCAMYGGIIYAYLQVHIRHSICCDLRWPSCPYAHTRQHMVHVLQPRVGRATGRNKWLLLSHKDKPLEDVCCGLWGKFRRSYKPPMRRYRLSRNHSRATSTGGSMDVFGLVVFSFALHCTTATSRHGLSTSRSILIMYYAGSSASHCIAVLASVCSAQVSRPRPGTWHCIAVLTSACIALHRRTCTLSRIALSRIAWLSAYYDSIFLEAAARVPFASALWIFVLRPTAGGPPFHGTLAGSPILKSSQDGSRTPL
jgi:hypothetical protein